MSPTTRSRYAARMPGPVVVSAVLAMFCLALPAPAKTPDHAWIKPKAGRSLLLDIARHDGRWMVVGERGHILISDDAESWRQVAAPTRVMLTAVVIGDGGTGFAVGHDATILRTRDNGDTWERVYEDPEEQAPLLDVVIAGPDRAVAVGAYGLYVETRDGGESWSRRVLEPRDLEDAGADGGGAGEEEEEDYYYDFHLNDIAIADSGRWYIAAEAGTVYRSDDQGESWLRLPSPYEGSFFGVLPLDGDDVLLFGLQGRLYRSGDAGASWRRIETGTDATLSSGLRLDDGTAMVVGYAGIVLNDVTAEDGPKRVRLENRPALSDARRLDDGRLLSVGDGGIRQWSAGAITGQ